MKYRQKTEQVAPQNNREEPEACELCGRAVSELTKHHLIPRTRHKNKRNKRIFSRQEVRSRLAWLCPPCHRHIHTLLENKQLEADFNTLEALASHPDVQKFVSWIKRQPESALPRLSKMQRR
jgi:hypothetical protein